MSLPVNSIGGAPHIVEKLALGRCGRVVGAAAEDPDAIFEHRAAADHAACGPAWLHGLNRLPGLAVGAVPEVAIEDFVRLGDSRHRLAGHDPELVLKDDGVMQSTR